MMQMDARYLAGQIAFWACSSITNALKIEFAIWVFQSLCGRPCIASMGVDTNEPIIPQIALRSCSPTPTYLAGQIANAYGETHTNLHTIIDYTLGENPYESDSCESRLFGRPLTVARSRARYG
jgi:hypothetical protein